MGGFGIAGDEYAGQLVNSMNALTGMINNYSDNQQTNRAYNSLVSGGGMPTDVNQRNQSKAYSMVRDREAAEQSQFNRSVRQETERLVGELRDKNWDFDAIEAPKTLAGISAFGHAADIATKFQDGKDALRKKRMSRIDKDYKDFRKVGGAALQSLNEGNFDAAVIDMKRASEMAPMPYRLTDFDPQSKTYGIEFRSDEKGGWTGTGRRLTVGQTGDAIKQFLAGEKTTQGGKTYNPVFAGAADRYMEATRKGNADVMKDPSKWIPMVNKQGHLIHAVPQNSLDYKKGVQYVVLDEDNGSTTMVDSLDKLPGYVRTSMDLREKRAGLAKTGADIEHTKAQTGKVYADTQKSYADAKKTAAEAQGIPDKLVREKLVASRKALGDALKPFQQKGTTFMNLDTGELTNEGNNAFNDASKLLEEYNLKTWTPTTEADKLKLQAATQAVGIYKQILKSEASHSQNASGASKKGHGYGKRVDGTEKGLGYFGELQRPDGSFSTEISIGVNIGGKEVEIPSLVPTLSQDEINHLLNGGAPTKAIVVKAAKFARDRIRQGKSPFAEDGEQVDRKDIATSTSSWKDF